MQEPEPAEPDTILRHALAAHQQGDLARAGLLYRQILRRQPGQFDANFLLGDIALRTSQIDLAVGLFSQCIVTRPDHAGAWLNRGVARAMLGRFAEALPDYDRAIALRPDHADAHYNRGNTLRDLGRLPEAVLSYGEAIALRPGHVAARNNRGNTLRSLGRPAEALADYDQALAIRPDHAEALNNRGAALEDLGRREEAAASFDRAITLRPDHAPSYKNRGAVLAGLGQFEAALADCDRAIALRPNYAEAHANRAAALICLGRIEEALRGCDQAIALKPDSPEARYAKGTCHLALGDFAPGWQGFEWRWKSRFGPASPNRNTAPWLGDVSTDSKTILVAAEQGLGDSLQFCRYVPLLAKRATVILDVPRPLRRLLSGLEGVSHIVGDGETPGFDAWVPMMSLPLAFGTTLETIPAAIPYLHANPEQSATWRRRLSGLDGLKVGLVWAGSPFSQQPRAQAMDRRRSVRLSDYAPLASIPGISLISLQKGEAAAQSPPDGMVLHDWTGELHDFADTAALVEALDLVISVDTAVVHLAGALGRPVWVLNRFDQCWRWLRGRTDSPWYPTARLFRQPAPGDWSGVIARVAEALSEFQTG